MKMPDMLRSIIVAALVLSGPFATTASARQLDYAQCQRLVMQSPEYLGGKDSNLACMQPCEAAITRCLQNGGRFD
jgi:hypothetical protein